MEKLADVYSSLFAHQSDETAPPCRGNTQQYPKVLLQKQEDRPSVLLQLSIYRRLFSLSNIGCNQYELEDPNYDHQTTETVITHTVESCRPGLCRRLAMEAESVINIVSGYLMSDDQFVSFAASKALTSFIMYIYIVTDSQSMTFEILLKWIIHLITVETFQTHVAVYTLQALTDVLKAVRKSSIETQGPAASLWVCVNGVLKHSLQLVVEAKELYKQLKGTEKNDRKCRIKWVELSVDALLFLCIETLHHLYSNADHMTISVCHVITSPDHMTKCRDLIYHNLLEFTSFLDCSQSIYILKELVRLHQKLLTCSFPERCESLLIHSSLLKLFQNDIFVKSAQSWLGSLSSSVNPTKVQCHVDAGVQTLDSAVAGHSSVTEVNEQGLTLKSNLISIVIRKEVLLILHYLVSVLTPDQVVTSPTQELTAGFIQLEELVSLVSRLLDLSTAVDLASPSVMAEAQRQLLELLSEQDGCLIEGLMLSCRITKSLKIISSLISPSVHPVLSTCLRLVHIHTLFVEFLSSFIFFDHSILIDYFISPETATTFRLFLSEYFRLAARDWVAVVRACEELDNRNSEIVPSDAKISDSEDTSEDKDRSPILSQKGATISPCVAVDSILTPCEQVDSRKGETIMPDSDTSRPILSVLLEMKGYSEYVDQDIPPSLNPEQAPAKRPRLDPDCLDLSEDGTSVSSPINSRHQRDPKDQQPQSDNANVSMESSDSEAIEGLESGESVYVETSLDKMMDCLTKFKYALQRLKNSHLLVTMDDSDAIILETIISSYEQLEHLYEAMEK